MSASLLFLLGLCLLISFLYAGIEAGLLSASRVRLRSRVHQGDRAAIRLDRLLQRPERLLATVLFVTNFADVAALVIVANALVGAFGWRGYVVTGAVMLPVYLFLLQLLPKSLFRRFPYRALARLGGLLEITAKVCLPVIVVAEWVGLLGLRSRPATEAEVADPELALAKRRAGVFVAREEFKNLAAEGERTGALSKAERGMINNVMDFGGLRVRELMLPAPEAMPLREGLTVRGLLGFARARGLEHLPVTNAQGELAALVDVYALLLDRNPERPVSANVLRRAPLLVQPADAATSVLRRLRSARLTAAAVVEGKRLVGIVRTKDLLQRLVRSAG